MQFVIFHWSFAKSVSPLSAASEIVRKNVAPASSRQPGKAHLGAHASCLHRKDAKTRGSTTFLPV